VEIIGHSRIVAVHGVLLPRTHCAAVLRTERRGHAEYQRCPRMADAGQGVVAMSSAFRDTLKCQLAKGSVAAGSSGGVG
jgi:hypothetical protein